MAEPLIPADVRALYEKLLGQGFKSGPRDDAMWQEPKVQVLLRSGLAFAVPRVPPTLTPTMPDTAFAKVMLRWQIEMDELRHTFSRLQKAAVRAARFEVRSRQRRNPRSSCTVVTNRKHVTGLHAVLSQSAKEYALALSTGPYGEEIVLPSGHTEDVRDIYLPPEPALFRRGGSYRHIIDEHLLRESPEAAASSFHDGEKIRVISDKLPTKMLIVDGHTAVVALGPYGHPCLLIRDQGIVNALVAYFELKWAKARPWAPPGVPLREKANGQRERILEALAAGLKDEAIARQQGISVKTVRRHISALMQELGATTRFAAGVAAVRRGWLSPAS